jgi:hypothetical protein
MPGAPRRYAAIFRLGMVLSMFDSFLLHTVLVLATYLGVAGCTPGTSGQREEGAPSTRAAAKPMKADVQEPSQEESDRAFDEEQAKIVLPVDPRHQRLELTPQWLEGYWVSGKAACYGSDSGIRFNSDRTYSEHDVGGQYDINGQRIRLRITEVYNAPPSEIGTGESFTVRLVGPNELDTTWSDGGSGPLYRCPPEPLTD